MPDWGTPPERKVHLPAQSVMRCEPSQKRVLNRTLLSGATGDWTRMDPPKRPTNAFRRNSQTIDRAT